MRNGLWLLCWVAGLAGAQPDPGALGPYAVGFHYVTWTDAARNNRAVVVGIFYPVDPASITTSTPRAQLQMLTVSQKFPVASQLWEGRGFDAVYDQPPVSAPRPFPLLVWSPGFGNPWWVFHYLATRLASHGVVFAAIHHPVPGSTVAVEAWHRPRDVRLVIDRLLARNEDAADLLSAAIRTDQIAAGGHSLGGYAALALAGGDDTVCDVGAAPTCDATAVDPRIKALVLLDASNQLLWFDELARVHLPALAMGRDWIALTAANNPAFQARQHAALGGHPNLRVDVERSDHLRFANYCEGMAVAFDAGLISASYLAFLRQRWNCDNPAFITPWEQANLVRRYVIAFLQQELAGRAGYGERLSPGWALVHEPDAQLFVTEPQDPQAIDGEPPDDFPYFQFQPGTHTAREPKDGPMMEVEFFTTEEVDG